MEQLVASLLFTAAAKSKATCYWTNNPCPSVKAHRAVNEGYNALARGYGFHPSDVNWLHSLVRI